MVSGIVSHIAWASGEYFACVSLMVKILWYCNYVSIASEQFNISFLQ